MLTCLFFIMFEFLQQSIFQKIRLIRIIGAIIANKKNSIRHGTHHAPSDLSITYLYSFSTLRFSLTYIQYLHS